MSANVITFGEALYRFTPPHQQRFAQAQALEWHVGGAEANVAVGLAHLGLDVTYLSRLTDNALGRHIAQTLRGYGVDTRPIIWTSHDRVGFYFVEDASPPRSAQVIYDRANSAFANLQADELAFDALTITPQTWLHTTGITLALGDNVCQSAQALWDAVRKQGGHLSFDVNYRQKLWTHQEAVQACEPFMGVADVIFIAERDARLLYDLAGDAFTILRQLVARYPQAVIVMSRGAHGVMGANHPGALYEQGTFPASGIGRIGGGDALASGFLYAHITGKSLQEALQWGTAFAALKYATLGDLPIITRAEVEQLLTSTLQTGLQR